MSIKIYPILVDQKRRIKYLFINLFSYLRNINYITKKRNIEYEIYNDIIAQYDFNQIEHYIEYKLQNPIAAKNIAKDLIYKISLLEQFPYLGKIYNSNNSNIRYLVCKKYLIFYEIQENEKLVIIKTIIHSKQNRKLF